MTIGAYPPGFPLADWGNGSDTTRTGWLGGFAWTEVVGSNAPDEGTFGPANGQVMMTININYQDEVNVVPNVLGYAQRTGTTASITTVAVTSNVATLTLAPTVSNIFYPGAGVTISGLAHAFLNGTWTVSAVFGQTFSFPIVHANVAATADAGSAQGSVPLSGTINYVSVSDYSASVALSGVSNPFFVGASITISGLSTAALNGTWTVTGVAGQNVTFSTPNTKMLNGTPDAGSMTCQVPLLHRYLPIQHPRYPWLYATRIAKIRHFAPVPGYILTALAHDYAGGSDSIAVTDASQIEAGAAIILGNSLISFPEGVMVQSVSGNNLTLVAPTLDDHKQGEPVFASNTMAQESSGLYIAQYYFSQLSILFSSLPFRVLTDAQLVSLYPLSSVGGPATAGDESKRFCEYLDREGAEFISRRVGAFKWAEGAGAATTQLTTPAKEGDTIITVGSIAGYVAGQRITVGYAGEPSELATIASTNVGNVLGPTITLQAALTATHSIGAPVAPVGTAPAQGGVVPFDLGQLLIKPTFVIKWYRVPNNWLMDANTNPLKLRAAMGTVNSDTFFGRSPGTLLMLEPDIQPVEEPINPLYIGMQSYEPPRAWNVTLSYKEFNPTSGLGVYFGHNLAPNPSDGKWYLVTADGTTTGVGQYNTSPFWQMFTSAT